ncbi:MAG TPA: CHAT domain-containing protein [Chitinophagaceae bacterium]|nr:CHAT domain-containing protein [Chitinophagaceae bacterium]
MKRFLTLLLLSFSLNLSAQIWQQLTDSLNYYSRQKNYTRSIAAGEKALTAAQNEFGQEHNNYGLALKNLSIAYRRNENYQEALTKASGALQVFKKNNGENSVEYASMLNQLGMIYTGLKDSARTIEVYNQAINILHHIKKGKDILESALYNLSTAHTSFKQYLQAIPHLEEMVLLQEEIYGKESDDYLEGLGILANAYKETEKINAAIHIRKTMAEISIKKYGATSVDYGKEMNRIAMLYESIRDSAQTEMYYKQALSIFRGHTPKPELLISVINNLADFYETGNRYNDALSLYQENDSLIKSLKGTATIVYITNAYNLARSYFHTNQFSLAESQCQNVYKLLKKVVEQNNPNYAISLNNLADLYGKMKNYSQAESLYTEVLQIRKAALGENDENYITALSNLARVYLDAADYKKAEPAFLQLADIAKAKAGISSIYYANKLMDLGNLCYNTLRYKEAEKYYLQVADIKKGISGDTTSDYASVAGSLGFLYHKMGLVDKAESWYNIKLSIRKKKYGEKNEFYLSELNSLADLYKSNKEMAKADSMYSHLKNEYRSIYGDSSKQYSRALQNLAIFYDSWEKFALAEPLHLQVIKIDNTLYGSNHENSIKNLIWLANSYREASQYDKTDSINNIVLEAILKKYGAHHLETAKEYDRHALWAAEMGMYTKAIQYNIKSVTIIENVSGTNNLHYINSLLELGKQYVFIENFNMGELTYLKAANIVKNVYGEDHLEYAIPLEKLADIYQRIGQNTKAERFFLRSLELKKKFLGPAHPETADTWTNLAEFYVGISKYSAARESLSTAMKIANETIGKESDKYGSLLRTMGTILVKEEKYKEAEPYLLDAVKQVEKSRERAWHAFTLSVLAKVYENLSEFSKARLYYEKSAAVWEATYGKNHVAYAIACQTLGEYFVARKEHTEAEKYLLQSLASYENTVGADNRSVSSVLKKLANFYQERQLEEKALPLLRRAKSIEIKNMMTLFTNLSEKEKGNYLTEKVSLNNTMNSFLYFYPLADKEFIAGNYDLQLLFKSMILSGTKNMISSLRESTDTLLRKIFEQWQLNKTILAKQYALPMIQRRSDLASIEDQTESLEKELSLKSSSFENQQQSFQTKTTDVVKHLARDESAIEFVRFKLIKNDRSDSIFYAAYILTTKDSAPVFVPLCEEKQLQKLFDSAGTTVTAMVSKFYRGLEVKNKNTAGALGTELYKLIWQPLEPYLKGVKKVSYSPAGKLYSIAFHALPVDSATVLMDKYQLQQYTSTRQVVLREQEKQNNKPQNITLFGDAAFTLDSLQIVKGKTKTENVSTNIYTPQNRGTRGGTWSNLPGTAQEVKTIQQLFDSNKISTNSFVQTTASEENLKALSGNSPQILHIATHGFFLPEPDKKRKENNLSNENTYTLADDPLLRSGLILAGGNYAWSGKTPIDGVEDGIATAYEISQLNLSNTELVVLSACETALGDVKGSEGVFGLQRAFKMAGVKKMIVSLWQVPDKETAELMTSFYGYWMKGKTINDAFTQAQADMRKKYSPFYWAAFVLVE